MAYIDPEGMFGGDRMAMLSDGAKLAWPWFWCASNSVGRVELNYRQFANGPFRQFHKPPSESQFWKWVAEFHEHFLMFVYQVNGQAWGQWDVTERYLPKYKLEADKRTPAPVAGDFLKWREQYQSSKVKALSSKCRIFSLSENFQKLSETSEKFPIGRGIGSGSGEELNPCAAGAAPESGSPPELPSKEPILFPVAPAEPSASWLTRQHDDWYATYWNRKGKQESRKAYEKRIGALVRELKITSDAAAAFLRNQVIEDHAKFRDTQDWEWRQNLHPSTWLNQRRWEDEPKAREVTPKRESRTAMLERIAREMEQESAKCLTTKTC